MSDYSEMLAVAREAAATAQKIILRYYQSGIEVIRKADNSPVTQADILATASMVRSWV